MMVIRLCSRIWRSFRLGGTERKRRRSSSSSKAIHMVAKPSLHVSKTIQSLCAQGIQGVGGRSTSKSTQRDKGNCLVVRWNFLLPLFLLVELRKRFRSKEKDVQHLSAIKRSITQRKSGHRVRPCPFFAFLRSLPGVVETDNDKHSHEIGEANLLFTRRGRKAAQDKGKLKELRSESIASNTDATSSPNPTSTTTTTTLTPQTQNSRPSTVISTSSVQSHDPHGTTLSPPALQQQRPPHPHPNLPLHHHNIPSAISLVAPLPSTSAILPQPSDASQERWDRMAILFASIRQHARGFEYPSPSVAALESVLIRLYLESPIGSSIGPGLTASGLNGNR